MSNLKITSDILEGQPSDPNFQVSCGQRASVFLTELQGRSTSPSPDLPNSTSSIGDHNEIPWLPHLNDDCAYLLREKETRRASNRMAGQRRRSDLDCSRRRGSKSSRSVSQPLLLPTVRMKQGSLRLLPVS